MRALPAQPGKYTRLTVVVVFCSLPLFGCSQGPEQTKTTGPGSSTATSAPASFETTAFAAKPEQIRSTSSTGTALPPAGQTEAGPVPDVFFAFNKASFGPRQREKLTAGIAWLQAHPKAKVTIEGHCDERGSSEYNLDLGERRANAIREYLVAAGVPAEQLHMVSYGEARPFAPGHDKEAWSLNR
ncbi:MAG TPA: OmpA family protein, partial [Candidatus Sulfotelmatobacter sp.]|nr:OmpA family protein [Candidatus Sulfotelmatobacter sp.]